MGRAIGARVGRARVGLAMTWALGRRMFGPRAGVLTALILATSLMWPLMARAVLTDMLVSSLVFSAGVVVAGPHRSHAEAPPRFRRFLDRTGIGRFGQRYRRRRSGWRHDFSLSAVVPPREITRPYEVGHRSAALSAGRGSVVRGGGAQS